MGAMKEMLMEFCSVVYPDNYDDQDSLFEDMCVKWQVRSFSGTVDEFRKAYEDNHIPPSITTEDMMRLMREFVHSGGVCSAPALTLRRVCHTFGVQYENN